MKCTGAMTRMLKRRARSRPNLGRALSASKVMSRQRLTGSSERGGSKSTAICEGRPGSLCASTCPVFGSQTSNTPGQTNRTRTGGEPRLFSIRWNNGFVVPCNAAKVHAFSKAASLARCAASRAATRAAVTAPTPYSARLPALRFRLEYCRPPVAVQRARARRCPSQRCAHDQAVACR